MLVEVHLSTTACRARLLTYKRRYSYSTTMIDRIGSSIVKASKSRLQPRSKGWKCSSNSTYFPFLSALRVAIRDGNKASEADFIRAVSSTHDCRTKSCTGVAMRD